MIGDKVRKHFFLGVMFLKLSYNYDSQCVRQNNNSILVYLIFVFNSCCLTFIAYIA